MPTRLIASAAAIAGLLALGACGYNTPANGPGAAPTAGANNPVAGIRSGNTGAGSNASASSSGGPGGGSNTGSGSGSGSSGSSGTASR